MAIQTYASGTDVNAWMGSTPDNVNALLRYATVLVARACNLDPYTAPPDVSTETGQALRDATCAQVQFWSVNGIDPSKGGYLQSAGLVQSAKVLSGEYRTDTTAVAKQAADAAGELCPLACELLAALHLEYVPVPLFDASSGGLASWGLPPRPYSSVQGWNSEVGGPDLAEHEAWAGYPL